MTPATHLARLADLQSAFASLTAQTDPDAVVPGLGAWQVRSLVGHLAGIHSWAGAMARGDTSHDLEIDVARLDAANLAALYTEHADMLHRTLDHLGPDAPGATLVGPGPASFWFRRQVHETLIHLGDLAAARAGAWTADVLDGVADVEPELWADGVDEVVTIFEPRQVRLGRSAPLARTVALRDAASGHTAVLGGAANGRAAQPPAATVTAPARTLDLLLWGRVAPADTALAVVGDPAALTDALAGAIVP